MKKAFTLAEVLITLGIIGVVAAMTLPSLINATQGKQLEAGFKKSYSVVSQALTQMEYEEAQPATWENYPYKTFAPAFQKYLIGQGVCSKNDNCALTDLSENPDASKRILQYKTYNKKTKASEAWFDEGQILTLDGMFIMINNSVSQASGTLISFDVNGPNKKPNAWGHDLFSFQVNNSGTLVPMGSPESHFHPSWGSAICDIRDTSVFSGLGCAYYAATEKDYFKNLPK